jgi:hypothetical protein
METYRQIPRKKGDERRSRTRHFFACIPRSSLSIAVNFRLQWDFPKPATGQLAGELTLS